MYIQCSTVIRAGVVSRNRKLVQAYRDAKTRQPRVRTIQKIERLPLLERSLIIYSKGGKKYLTSEEWLALEEAGLLTQEQVPVFEIGDVYRGAGTAVALEHLNSSGMFRILDKHLNRSSQSVIKELIIHQLLYPKSKLSYTNARKSGLIYLLEGKKDYKEDTVYGSMDQLEMHMEAIIKDLTGLLPKRTKKLLLYDLSNSYFTGTKAELGGRGASKEKRHDRYIVTYGLVMNEDNMPMNIRIWKGGTADVKTVLDTFASWKQLYRASHATWIADRSMSGEPTLEDIKKLDLHYITGLPGNTQEAVLLMKHESQPELFDQIGISSFTHENKRFVLCRHQSKGYRKESQNAEKRRKVYDALLKIHHTPKNKEEKQIYHRAMKVLEKQEQTGIWDITIVPFQAKDNSTRYRLNFKLNRKAAITKDRIGHYYLLQTDMSEKQIKNELVVDNYQSLMMVEKSFRDIKSQIEIRPIRHWKERRIKAHIYLCYLSLWLSKYIENQWRDREIHKEVGLTLQKWDEQLLMCEKVNAHGEMMEVKWNKGRNAKKTLAEIETFGEISAIKKYS
jgi:transposase